MKSIKKITNKVSNNFSAIAGSALLVGATLTGAAGMASAQDGSSGDSMANMDLGEYPQPFVSEDGEVQTSIVLGSDAAVTDVVGATEIAGSLGAAAFGEETVSAEGGNFGFSASNGVTLDTRNDQLYFGDQLNTVRETLTEDDLEVLSETTFTDDNNDETDVTNYLNVGQLPVTFGNSADELDNEDPELHVELPSEGSVQADNVAGSGTGNFVYNLQANFEDGIDFTSSDVAGEEIELFGTDYTVAEENNVASGETRDELLLYGSSQEVDVSSGESTTITINEEEVTIEVVSVNTGSTSSGESGNAAVRVDGTLESVESGDTIAVNNEEVRIDEIIKTGGSESSDGVVNFEIGSQELVLKDGDPLQDSDGDDIEGSRVYFNGPDGSSLGDIAAKNSGTAISSIDLFVGAEDDDEDALTAGDTFSHSALPGVEVHFAGLNPDASEETDSTEEVTVDQNGDEDLQIGFTSSGGEDTTLNFVHRGSDVDTDGLETGTNALGDSDDGENYVITEGQPVSEDDYVATDAGDFSHMWEVTGIDRDETGGTIASGSEATIDLRDAVSGDTVEVELDARSSGDAGDASTFEDGDEYYSGSEVIDGQTYHFALEGDDSDSTNGQSFDSDGTTEFKVAWDDNADHNTGGSGIGVSLGDYVSWAPSLDTQSGAVALTQPTAVSSDVELELPSTQSTDADRWDVDGSTPAVHTTNGGITYSHHYVPLEQTDSAEDSIADTFNTDNDQLDVTYNTDNNADDNEQATVQVLYADGSTDSVSFDFSGADSGSASATKAANEGTAIGLVVTGQSNAETGDSIDVEGVEVVSSPEAAGHVGTPDNTVRIVSGGDQVEEPAAVYQQPEDDSDNEHAFVFAPTDYDGDDGYSVSVPDYTASLSTTSLDSDDDLEQGYTQYGSFVEVDSEDQGDVMVRVPNGQSVAGAAVTGADGSLDMGGGSGSATAASPTYSFADGLLTDDGSVGQARDNDNLVLVGGPAANSLTQELVEENQTMPAGDYTQGQGMIQMVDGFSEGNSALVVAGATGEDTRTAAEFLADYRNNQDALEGNSQVTIETSSGSVVN